MISKIIISLSDFASNTIVTLGYPGLIGVMVLENVFPPIPSEAVLPFAGYLSTLGTGTFNFWLVVLSGVLGSVLGAEILYAVGYWGNEAVVRRFIRRFGKWALISEDDLDKSEEWFSHHGPKAVFTARMIPIVRSLISVPAGLAKMPQVPFLLYTIIGTTFWSFILTFLGKVLGQNWPQITEWVNRYEKVTLVIALLVLGTFVHRRVKGRPSSDE